jgi:hypothetical protein
MHCPACSHKFGFFKSLLIVNPFRIRCPSCGTSLTMGRFGAVFLVVGFLFGVAIAEVAIYMKEYKSWSTADIVLWFLVAFPTVIGAYEWLGWRYAKLREQHEREGRKGKQKI